MKFDVFFSICQTPVNGYMPSERVMLQNFFSQCYLADQLDYGTAWVAETHLSCQTQKLNSGAVIPQFEGEIGINTDILQLAHIIFGKTKQIKVGSAIRNILCNGGPIAHAEAIRTFLTLHGLNEKETRKLEIGFASGRFPFSNFPYGVYPKNEWEKVAWPALRGKIFREATEIFLRLIKGEKLASKNLEKKALSRQDFRSDVDWERVLHAFGSQVESIPLQNQWNFDPIGVIPFDAPLNLLNLTIGCHDLETQLFANQIYPCGVFNLSITPAPQIETTHRAMLKGFHPSGGPWTRSHMPRTVLVFLNENLGRAKAQAQSALETYWKALEGTLDPEKIKNAVGNALIGDAAKVRDDLKARFHPDDRLMLWFDFFNHDNEAVKKSMRLFMDQVAPKI